MPEASKIALVTGGARRIGKAICTDLARHGFAVAIHCNRSREDAEALARSIQEAGGRAAAVQADLTDMDAVSRLVEEAAARLGPVDLLVNNASVFDNDTVTDFAFSAWNRHFDVHVKAPVLLARQLHKALPAGQDGLIVNIIDQRVWKPTPLYFSYTLSKATLWTATRTMAQALAPRIRVNAIGPGPTLASMRQQQADFDAQVKALLLQRGPALPEFGAAIRYLWEARSVTGQMIALDGGQHLAWQTPDVAGVAE
jgi:NAD(P)-dependent dehydrogenase (short-subunit alcohol dehydrogenase family)